MTMGFLTQDGPLIVFRAILALFSSFMIATAGCHAADLISDSDLRPMLRISLRGDGKNFRKSYFWQDDGSLRNTTIPTSCKDKNSPKSVTVGRNHPNGIRVVANFKDDKSVKLPIFWPRNFRGIDKFGFLNDGYYLQIHAADLDGDRCPEILIAVGDGLSDMGVHVLKFSPPARAADMQRLENWQLLGFLEGQSDAAVTEDSIVFRLGGTGRVVTYMLVKGKFVEFL